MFDPNVSLSVALSVIAKSWKEDFREYWALDATEPPEGVAHEDWQHRKVVSWLARVFVRSAKSLDQSEGDPVEFLMLFDRHEGIDLLEDAFLAECIQLELADDLDDELENMAERTLQLLAYVTRVQSHRARAYLQRVADCYIRGLRTETVVMCGAVLDAALQEHLPKEVIQAEGKQDTREPSLGDRIHHLRRTRQVSRDVVDKAWRLAHARNAAVHTAPEIPTDLLTYVGLLADVLEAVFPHEDGQST
jgi:hypothetical protein